MSRWARRAARRSPFGRCSSSRILYSSSLTLLECLNPGDGLAEDETVNVVRALICPARAKGRGQRAPRNETRASVDVRDSVQVGSNTSDVIPTGGRVSAPHVKSRRGRQGARDSLVGASVASKDLHQRPRVLRSLVAVVALHHRHHLGRPVARVLQPAELHAGDEANCERAISAGQLMASTSDRGRQKTHA